MVELIMVVTDFLVFIMIVAVLLATVGNFCGDDVLKDLKCPLRSIDLAINQNITLHGIEQLSQSVSGSLRHLGLARCVGLMACKGTLLNRLSELFPSLVSLDLW